MLIHTGTTDNKINVNLYVRVTFFSVQTEAEPVAACAVKDVNMCHVVSREMLFFLLWS